MDPVIAILALLLGVALLGLMVLTAVGERRRGNGVVRSGVAGLFFPIAWAVWYQRDERPSRA